MRWFWKFLDQIYRNIYRCCLWLACFFFVVAFVAISAQYIGDNLSQRILNNKNVVIKIAYDDDAYNIKMLDEFLQNVQDNNNLKDLRVKFKKVNVKDDDLSKGKFTIIMTKNQEFMDKMVEKNQFAILDDNIFTSYVKPYVEFSKYNEYANVETLSGTKIYIAYSSKLKNAEKTGEQREKARCSKKCLQKAFQCGIIPMLQRCTGL